MKKRKTVRQSMTDKSVKKCNVCGFENSDKSIQCRKCSIPFKEKTFLERIKVFKRLDRLEEKLGKHSATLMKIIKENEL